MMDELTKRTSTVERCAGTLLVTRDKRLVLQLRDDKPNINFPGGVCAFGGALEKSELPLEGAVRELNEETNLGLSKNDLRPYMVYKTHQYQYRHELIVCFFIAEGIALEGLEVYEGQGPYIATTPDDPLIVFNTRPVVTKWFAENHA